MLCQQRNLRKRELKVCLMACLIRAVAKESQEERIESRIDDGELTRELNGGISGREN